MRSTVGQRLRPLLFPTLQRRALLTQSRSKGPAEPPLLEQTVGENLSSIVSKHGDRVAIISRHQNQHLSYNVLNQKSNALARGFAGIGVSKGDRVAVSLGNNIEHAIATYALFKLGAILVPLNPTFNINQVAAALTHLDASHLVIGTETCLSRKDPRSNVPLLRQLVPNLEGKKLESELVPSLRHVVVVDNSAGRVDPKPFSSTTSYEAIAQDPGLMHSLKAPDLHPDEIINIQFTSGTTSTPKAACLSHKSILNNGKSIGERMLLTERDLVCCPPPLFHCFGNVCGYMATATHGAAIVFPAEAFDAVETLHSLRDYRCTALYGVPTMFIAQLEALQEGMVSLDGFENLRTGTIAGSTVAPELMRILHQRLNLTELTICYGMTETSPISAMTTMADPMDRRIDSVGRLLPNVEAKIVAPDDPTRILPIGERGEVAVSGYHVMKGYWEAPSRTAEVLIPDTDGKVWMHSGDEGMMDAEGFLKITGRLKDLIIRGGENIHPLEIENCLLAHPAIADVAVVGLPDDRYGECVAAFAVAHCGASITSDEVRDWVRARLSHHLVPKFVFPTENFPKTASGKVQKYQLRIDGANRLGDEMGDQRAVMEV